MVRIWQGKARTFLLSNAWYSELRHLKTEYVETARRGGPIPQIRGTGRAK